MDRNNTSFPLHTFELLKGKKFTPSDVELYHQFLVKEYLIDNPNQRGVLAFHGMGTGKTNLGMINIKQYLGQKKIVILAPKSVFSRFEDEAKRQNVPIGELNFISLKASNLGTQIERLEDDTMEKRDVFRKTSLDNTLLIVDEAHNLFNAIVNGSKNAVELYDSIMSARNIKILFLSGSPIINTPFELVPCFNMLAGHKLFPENAEDFEKYFLTKDYLRAQNKWAFKNRIFGLVSYYGDWIQAVIRADRPQRLPTQVIKVPMSEHQYAVYSTYRDKEHEEHSGQFRTRKSADRFSPKSSVSSYRIRSRMASNFVPLGDDGIEKEITCPKFHKALEIIKRHKNQPGMVYSNFVNKGGILDFARLLEKSGWEEWDEDTNYTGEPRYAVISGDTPLEMRTKIQKIASSKENLKGQIIQVVLVSPAASEGIEFLNFRYVIELDPFFNAVRGDQVENRIDRYKSHEMLPPKERTVQTYYLLATYPIDKASEAKEPTTDEYLFMQSKKRKVLSLEFYKLLVEASIDCHIYRNQLPKERASKIDCLFCAPTDQPLFTNSLERDIKSKNPCRAPEQETIKAKEILVGDKKYMYTVKDKIAEFYEYKPNLDGYIVVKRNNPDYDLLVDAVIGGDDLSSTN